MRFVRLSGRPGGDGSDLCCCRPGRWTPWRPRPKSSWPDHRRDAAVSACAISSTSWRDGGRSRPAEADPPCIANSLGPAKRLPGNAMPGRWQRPCASFTWPRRRTATADAMLLPLPGVPGRGGERGRCEDRLTCDSWPRPCPARSPKPKAHSRPSCATTACGYFGFILFGLHEGDIHHVPGVDGDTAVARYLMAVLLPPVLHRRCSRVRPGAAGRRGRGAGLGRLVAVEADLGVGRESEADVPAVVGDRVGDRRRVVEGGVARGAVGRCCRA